MLLYIQQAVFRAAQPEVLNQAIIAVEGKSQNMTLKLVQENLMRQIMCFKQVHVQKYSADSNRTPCFSARISTETKT